MVTPGGADKASQPKYVLPSLAATQKRKGGEKSKLLEQKSKQTDEVAGTTIKPQEKGSEIAGETSRESLPPSSPQQTPQADKLREAALGKRGLQKTEKQKNLRSLIPAEERVVQQPTPARVTIKAGDLPHDPKTVGDVQRFLKGLNLEHLEHTASIATKGLGSLSKKIQEAKDLKLSENPTDIEKMLHSMEIFYRSTDNAKQLINNNEGKFRQYVSSLPDEQAVEQAQKQVDDLEQALVGQQPDDKQLFALQTAKNQLAKTRRKFELKQNLGNSTLKGMVEQHNLHGANYRMKIANFRDKLDAGDTAGMKAIARDIVESEKEFHTSMKAFAEALNDVDFLQSVGDPAFIGLKDDAMSVEKESRNMVAFFEAFEQSVEANPEGWINELSKENPRLLAETKAHVTNFMTNLQLVGRAQVPGLPKGAAIGFKDLRDGASATSSIIGNANAPQVDHKVDTAIGRVFNSVDPYFREYEATKAFQEANKQNFLNYVKSLPGENEVKEARAQLEKMREDFGDRELNADEQQALQKAEENFASLEKKATLKKNIGQLDLEVFLFKPSYRQRDYTNLTGAFHENLQKQKLGLMKKTADEILTTEKNHNNSLGVVSEIMGDEEFLKALTESDREMAGNIKNHMERMRASSTDLIGVFQEFRDSVHQDPMGWILSLPK